MSVDIRDQRPKFVQIEPDRSKVLGPLPFISKNELYLCCIFSCKHLKCSLESSDLGLNSGLADTDDLGIDIGRAGSEEINDSLVILPVGRAHALDDVGGGIGGEGVVSGLELGDDVVLGNAALDGVEEELTGSGPRNGLLDNSLGLHTASLVMQIGKLSGSLKVDRLEKLLARGNLLFNGHHGIVVHGVGSLKLGIEKLELRIDSVHDLELVGKAELDLRDTGRLEDTTTRIRVGKHRHLFLVDGGVDNDPRTSTKLAMGGQVDVDGVLVLAKGINDLGTELENLAGHITATAGESTPVGKDHDGKTLLVEVLDGLGRLEGGIGEENLTSLGEDGLTRVGISRIGGDDLLNKTSLNSDGAHWNTTQAATADDDALAPASEVLLEGIGIKEASGILSARKHETRIVRSRSGAELDVTVDGVGTVAAGSRVAGGLGNEAEPLDDGANAFLIVVDNLVRNTVGEHDLGTTELILGVVDITSKELVEGGVSGKDHGTLLHLDDALAKTVEVGADTDTAAGDVTEGEDLVVSTGGLTGDLTTALEVLDTNAVDLSNDVIDSPALVDLVSVDSALGESLVIRIG
mmetsp:Transcript_13887/g.33109  ORF Transcript_13887/g.33109 Transcript_13887/m.33109 type:complete len:578 (-) Transcript_13887:4136-5869(-)